MLLMQMMKRLISLLLVAVMIGGQAMPLQAAMIGTDTLLQQQQARFDREQLAALLERDEVQQQLVALGVDMADAKRRVAQLTDSEVQQLNARLGELPAGSGSTALSLLVVVILALVFGLVAQISSIFTE
jgi:RNase H-fold protein (predicted Holliday junction resolvase)